MTTEAKHTLKVDLDTTDATRALEALAAAAEKATEALKGLAGVEHGGLSIKMVGSIMTCDVKPPTRDAIQ